MTSKIKALVSADMIFLLLLALSGSSLGLASEILYYSAFIIPTVMMLSFAYKPDESLHASAPISNSDVINDLKKDFSISGRALAFSLPLICPAILITLLISLGISVLLGSFGFDNTTVIESHFALALVTHALIPAVLEEMLFRLAPIKLLRENKKTALILSSVMFAFAHANLFQIPYALSAGFIFGMLYIVTGSILPSIVLHFLNNSVSLLSIYGTGSKEIVLTLSLLSFISLIFVVIYRRFFKNEIKNLFEKKKIELSYHPLFFIITSLVLAISMLFA